MRIVGEQAALRTMVESWAGRLAARVSVAEDGTVTFGVTQGEVADDACASLLYELVTHRSRFVFYAGTDADFVADMFTNYDSQSDRELIRKRFARQGVKFGGGHAVGTSGRAHALQPSGGEFAVIAYNTRARMWQVATSYFFPSVEHEEQAAGVGLPVSSSSYFIHEAAENLAFAAQKASRCPMNYDAAHGEAMSREAEIRRQRGLSGGFAGGEVTVTGDADSAPLPDGSQRPADTAKDSYSFFGTLYRGVKKAVFRTAQWRGQTSRREDDLSD